MISILQKRKYLLFHFSALSCSALSNVSNYLKHQQWGTPTFVGPSRHTVISLYAFTFSTQERGNHLLSTCQRFFKQNYILKGMSKDYVANNDRIKQHIIGERRTVSEFTLFHIWTCYFEHINAFTLTVIVQCRAL